MTTEESDKKSNERKMKCTNCNSIYTYDQLQASCIKRFNPIPQCIKCSNRQFQIV